MYNGMFGHKQSKINFFYIKDPSAGIFHMSKAYLKTTMKLDSASCCHKSQHYTLFRLTKENVATIVRDCLLCANIWMQSNSRLAESLYCWAALTRHSLNSVWAVFENTKWSAKAESSVCNETHLTLQRLSPMKITFCPRKFYIMTENIPF